MYVSTVENNLPEFVLRGYFHGKQRAEAAVLEKCVREGEGGFFFFLFPPPPF